MSLWCFGDATAFYPGKKKRTLSFPNNIQLSNCVASELIQVQPSGLQKIPYEHRIHVKRARWRTVIRNVRKKRGYKRQAAAHRHIRCVSFRVCFLCLPEIPFCGALTQMLMCSNDYRPFTNEGVFWCNFLFGGTSST